jgi:hypothetical protein
VGFCGWVLPPDLKVPANYETINKATIAKYEGQMNSGPITYRTGHYTSLFEYSGNFINILEPGTIVLYKTAEGNYGKLRIAGYAYYHAWSKVRGYLYCDVPFFYFTTYRPDGTELISGGYPFILDTECPTSYRGPLYGLAPSSPFLTFNFQKADYPERPQGASFMWFYFDFDTNYTGFFDVYGTWKFEGIDIYNEKTENNSRFYPRNGAKFLIVYRP